MADNPEMLSLMLEATYDPENSRADLIEWRKANRFTKQQAARVLGINRDTYARYESGETQLPMTVALASIGYNTLMADATNIADEIRKQNTAH